jgi:hypothetical protein
LLVKIVIIIYKQKKFEVLTWESRKHPFLSDEGPSLARRGLG